MINFIDIIKKIIETITLSIKHHNIITMIILIILLQTIIGYILDYIDFEIIKNKLLNDNESILIRIPYNYVVRNFLLFILILITNLFYIPIKYFIKF